jgi:hypothetical protein
LENKGFRNLLSSGVVPRCCDYDLRFVTNPSPVSIALRGRDVARGRFDRRGGGPSSLIAQREFIRDELIASVARFAADKACAMENRWTDCLCSDLHAKSH